MENSNILKQYKTIGRVSSVISKSETLEEAIKGGLKEILKGLDMEYAVIWYQDKKGDLALHPYFWIAPVDLTLRRHAPGCGVVGQVFDTRKPVRALDYRKHKDEDTDRDFEGMDIISMVCVPLSDGPDNPGCIQFINTSGSHMIAEEEADICEILCLMAAVAIDDKIQDFTWQDKKPLMRVRDIHKEFVNGDLRTKILNGVNLDIYEGEFLTVLGESGCGKSTLLNILGGLDNASSGDCIYCDDKITTYSEKQLTSYRRYNVGFVFQSYNLMPNLTAKQNLDLIGELVEDPMDSVEALKMVGLGDKCDFYPFQLSGGQQQRVSIARALIKKPRLILADEPTAALDYATSIEVLEVLKYIMKTGTTLVMVTHNEQIARMADRVVRMRGGRTYEITVNKHPVSAEELIW